MSHGKIVVEESDGGSHGKRVVDGCPRSHERVRERRVMKR
jgi:hypothetical protein